MRFIPRLALVLVWAVSASAQDAAQGPDSAAASRILEHIRVLSSDEFEGRAPGTPGEDKAVAYIQHEFIKLGLKPGNPDGTYIQNVPMDGILSSPSTTFAVGGKTLTPLVLNDYVAVSRHIAPQVDVKDSDIVFVGYGVVAPEYGWDDFKGVDVRGKTVVMLINDPPVRDLKDPSKLDDSMFKGKAMTYYGRWTYKYEEASAKGAAACLIVHETGPAGYPYAVVSGSWGRENFVLESADGNAGRVPIEGWLTLDFAKRLFAAAGQDFDTLKSAAVSKDFRPVAFNAKASFSVTNKIRPLASRNVIAKIEGSKPARSEEYVIYTAHWDHLGRNTRLKGDQIFNGALDNASGCAGILEIAREFTQLPPAERPERSILFLAVTGEEQGLLGSEYYAQHPLYPLTKTLADINIDVLQPSGRARDLEVIGYGNTTIEDVARDLLAKDGRIMVPDLQPEKGGFYRSDHFEFAKVGVPSFYAGGGEDIIGKPEGYGHMRRDEYVANDYHKVTDEIKPWWDLSGAAQDADLLFRIGQNLAKTDQWPQWKPGCEFKARRDAMMAGTH